MKIELAIEAVHASEARLARELVAIGERHRADHDVFHLTRTLAEQAQDRLRSLEPHAQRYGASAEDGGEPGGDDDGPIALLRDLRRLHLLAAAASIDWTILGQGAQAARDAELLAAVSASHPETLRGLNWTTTRLKEAAPQVLTS